MKRWQRIVLGIGLALGVIIIVLGAGIYWLGSSFDDLCGNTVVATEFSPDHAMKAVLFERNCGATTGFSSQVSVLPVNEALPNDGGNVFSANEGEGGEATSWGGPFVALHWRDPHTLSVSYEPGTDIRFSQDRLDDVTILFDKKQ